MLMREQKLARQTTKESWQYRLLMAIPRNLVYVFLCVIVGAFAGMLYIVYFQNDLGSVFSSGALAGQDYEGQSVRVHPLYDHFRKIMDEYVYIPEETRSSLSSQAFYQKYLTKNVPVLVTDGC